MSDQELEVKFYVADLSVIAERLHGLNARLTQPRTLEINLRFDTPLGRLTRDMQVLRLRQDTEAHLTYKGPPMDEKGVRSRQEIEFIVSDFAAAQAFLQALGYQVNLIYEKYRAAYDLDGCEVSLDELPYGCFVEVEGSDSQIIRQVSDRLGLDWQAIVPLTYTALFARLRACLGLTFRDLTFKDFADRQVTAEELGVRAAEEVK